MAEIENPEEMRDEVRAAWHRYVDVLAPLRPVLHGYCRRLAGNVWDAEDLVQDTLLRAFGHLGFLGQEIRNPRAYLLRTATNVWIDAARRREVEGRAMSEGRIETQPPPDARATEGAVRDAAGAVLRLSPQERAAVVLKDAFDMNLEEVAEVLATTVGAVKAALHRGRGRLREPEDAAATDRRAPSAELIDRWVDCYHAQDVKGLVELMVDGGSAENVGCGLQYGRDAFAGKENFLYKSVHGHEEWPPPLQPESVRVERVEFEGEPILLGFATRRGREGLETILRFDEADGRIARIRGYAFCPETMREVGKALGLRVRTGLYRYPTPAPGEYYGDAPGAAPR